MEEILVLESYEGILGNIEKTDETAASAICSCDCSPCGSPQCSCPPVDCVSCHASDPISMDAIWQTEVQE